MALFFDLYKKRFSGPIHFYGNASHAFYDVLVWLQNHRPRQNPNVIMPVYIPAKLYRTVLAAGYIPKFYDISLDCGIAVDHIKSLVDKQTQAVFCVHYFGIPSAVNELKDFTDDHDIFLIEDCAHTLASQWKGKELGSIGDCAIFSGRKMLQLPAGGFLVLNNQPWEFEPDYNKRVRSIFTACKLLRSRLKYLYFDLTRGYDPLNLAWIPSTGYIDFSDKHQITVQDISLLNKMYTHLVDLEKVVNRRRGNYEYVLNGIKDIPGITPVPQLVGPESIIREDSEKLYLEKGITPYSFPVLVPGKLREGIRKILCRKGIGCGAGWPESPFNLSRFKNTSELSERLLELPIHHGMKKAQLQRMIECLQSLDLYKAQEYEIESHYNFNKERKAEVA